MLILEGPIPLVDAKGLREIIGLVCPFECHNQGGKGGLSPP